MPQTIKNLLIFYIDKQVSLPCWIWTGTIQSNGYGKVTVNYKTVLAHRFIYEQIRGRIPDGLELDHVCQNKLCVNPDHLEPVTSIENRRRRSASQTQCKRGHPLSDDNLYVTPDGRRQCIICRRAAVRRYSRSR